MSKPGSLRSAADAGSGGVNGHKLIWSVAAALPRPVAGHMAAVRDGRLLVIGGSYWENKRKYWTDQVQSLDLRTNTWHNDTPLPHPRSDAAFVTVRDDVYIFGGGAGTGVRSDALVLQGAQWSALRSADLPEPRLYPSALACGDFIYLLGGMSEYGDYRTIANTFWRWPLGSQGWEILPSLPGPGRILPAVTELDGALYVFGGATTGPRDVENLFDAYKYEPAHNEWTRLPDLPVANRSWCAVSLGHRALLLAGYTNDFAREVYLYEAERNLQPVSLLPHALADIRFCLIGSTVVGAGGEAGHHIRGKWTFRTDLPASWLSYIRGIGERRRKTDCTVPLFGLSGRQEFVRSKTGKRPHNK